MATGQYTWLHIGAGSFHRAHQAWYLHTLREKGKRDWSIALGNIRDDVTPTLEKLAAQDCRYTLETVTPSGKRAYQFIYEVAMRLKGSYAPGLGTGRRSGRVPALPYPPAGQYCYRQFIQRNARNQNFWSRFLS